MATITFRIRKGKNEQAMIYVRYKHGSKFDAETSTQITIKRKHWSDAKQQVKLTSDSDDYRDNVNNQLEDLKRKISAQYTKDNHTGTAIDSPWLKNVVALFHNKKSDSADDKEIFLASYGDYYCEIAKGRINSRTGKLVTLRTTQDNQNAINKVKSFEIHISKRPTRLDEIDLIFHKRFIDYLRTFEMLGSNTIGGIIDILKKILRDAEASGYKVHPAHKSREFYSPSFKPVDIYFDKAEIAQIRACKFEADSFLDNARDWLIIGLWSGLRVSDLLSITKLDVTDNYIDNTNFKTKIPVVIPLHPDTKKALQKRDGNFPRKISDQKFNDYIKLVAKEAGISQMVDGGKMVKVIDGFGNEVSRKVQGSYPKHELVTSHICRRSFATNLYGKIDTLTIMKITGHRSEKQFLDYVKITPKHHAEKLAELWSKWYEKESPTN